MDYVQRAKELYLMGYSCAQAIIGAFCDAAGDDLSAVCEVAGIFGGQAARERGLCGAACGMCLAAGMVYSGRVSGRAVTELVFELAGEFQERFGSLSCRELIRRNSASPGDTSLRETREFCSLLVEEAARMLARRMERDGIPQSAGDERLPRAHAAE
jgi:C_GCAxxG_C_C family probable redox protein